MHLIVGSCDALLFGVGTAERLRRQMPKTDDLVLAVDATAVLGDATVAWLMENPGALLVSDSGRPLAIAVAADDEPQAAAALTGEAHGFAIVDSRSVGPQFIRKLRRSSPLLAHSLAEDAPSRIERALFADVYKGVTDLVTKWVWPEPAFWATKAAAHAGVSPNMITGFGILLTFGAAWFFYTGALAAGLAAAWLMTFLDTVDGKLARVTVRSSAIGNLLDHITDYVHPPVWWICLAIGIARIEAAPADLVWASCWVIIGAYAVGRLIEEAFKRLVGFNQYMWRRFDSAFRLVVARRNVILLLMSAGLILGLPAEAYAAAAVWSFLSVLIQAVRFGQAALAHRRHPQSPWLA